MKFQRKKVATALGIGGFALLAAGSVLAQDIRVNVTGTNIKRVDSETAAPIETITREDIQASGLQTIADVLRQITANNNGQIGASFTNGFSASGSGVSLRGLGPNNTLVLVNGRRMANFGLADDGHASYVDIQQIPFDAVERIEVLKDGASAVYGSDAVAGVVNIILRQQFTGVTVTGTAGTTVHGEGNQYKGAITLGMGDLTKDRYNVYVTIDGQRQEANPYNKQRDYIGSNNLTFMGLPDTRPGNPLGFGSMGTGSLVGNVRPVDPATGGSPDAFQSLPGCAAGNVDPNGGFCRYEVKDFSDIMPEVERFNVFARGSFNFTATTQGYAELSYFQVKTDTRSTPSSTRANWYDPATNTIASSFNIFLPVGHPDNPFNATNQGAQLYYVAGDVGGRDATYETNTQRYLAGVKGTNWGWDWDLAGLFIRTETDAERKGFFLYDRLLQGLAGTTPYGYYRIGANASLNNPAIYGYIAPSASWKITSENSIFDAKASRDIYKLDGGQLALAVGYEYRKEELSNPGTPGTETGNVVGLGYSAAFGSRVVNAFFAELHAPILKNLELTAAVRFDDYSDVGNTTNPKVGVKWTVVPQLVLRGTWATAFRAPGLYETSTANASAGGTSVVDPVRCPITGLDADCQAPVLSINIGNPLIKPETSDTYTVGLIWEPMPGLSGTLDYWNISSSDQITIGSAQAVANNPASFPAATVGRDTNNLPGIPNSGTLLYVSTPYQNANKVKTDGIDLDVVWKQSLKEWGTLSTEFQWTHVINYNQTFPNGQTFKYVGTQGNYDVSSGSATPEDRMNLIIGWTRGRWNVVGTVRYVSDYQSTPYQDVVTPDECLSVLDFDTCHVSSFTTLDLSAAYTGFKNWQIFGSVINVFDRIAPFNPAAAYGSVNFNYNYAFSGGTGTQWNLGARYTFQ
jgi:iron complex outermembrane receptor protein